MLRAAIVFFIIGLLAILFGANNLAGVSMELGRTLLFVFLVLAIISFIASLVSGRGRGIVGVMLASTLALGLAAAPFAHAEDFGNKAADATGDVKTQTKKSVRTAKRNVRKATGNDSAVKDARDSVNDAGDQMQNDAAKAKRKAQ